ncbi:hypothetical protein PR048_015202 [Dryococelus australis]|uniref:Uncharacterized protein n=1 Tax=Dryococelus australis TaxID=614101 RepID=A0ABQ9HGJ3_9NEOP|nr:hypothetical protein PR048_015202 [Dryococelus australis]
MIVTDSQPFSMVEDEEFQQFLKIVEPSYTLPRRQDKSSVYIPNLYDKAKEKLEVILREIVCVSLTTDLRSSSNMNDYLTISDKVTAVVQDNKANLIGGLERAQLSSLSCAAYTLQFVVKDGCMNQASVNNLVSNSRRVVGHFRHSISPSKLLRRTQKELGFSEQKLLQGEPTHWNSTHYMLNRLFEQKRVMNDVLLQLNTQLHITAVDWMEPHGRLSSRNCTASEIIQFVNSIHKALESDNTRLKGMRNDLHSLNIRYPPAEIEKNPTKSLATLLDPS